MAGNLRVRGFFCSLPCAEITLRPGAPGRAAVAEGGCPICREEILRLLEEDGPPARVGRRETTLEEALEAAADILIEARAPFLFGLSRSSNLTVRLAACLAAAVRGSLDLEGADRAEPGLLSLQTFGLPGATFGEIAGRADLLILWRCDPRESHPRLFARPPATPLGPGGRRAVILVPPAGGAAGAADLALPLGPGADLDAALAIRALSGGRTPAGDPIGGLPRAALARAVEMIAGARYVGILWDLPAAFPGRAALAAALTLLARDLAGTRRCAAVSLAAAANLAGAMGAVAGTTGFPRAVGFASGRPRYAPGECDAGRMIGRGAADALLLIGVRSIPGSRPGGPGAEERAARPAAGRLRTIVVGPRLPEGARDPDVTVLTAAPGLSAAGSARRADGVPVVLRAVLKSSRPTEESVIETLARRIAAGRGARAREAAP